MNDSKKLWLDHRAEIHDFNMKLGPSAADMYVNDPRMLAFTTSRYKFASKMLEGAETCLEIGSGDGFGAPLVAQSVEKLICTDIDEEMALANQKRMKVFKNISFQYHDFRASAFSETVDGAYLIDVIEHVYEEEEDSFLSHIAASLKAHGVCLIGTPNVMAEQYASENARKGHVNLKDFGTLKTLSERYFHNVFMFSMNDEVVHTGFSPMAHFLWALCVAPKK